MIADSSMSTSASGLQEKTFFLCHDYEYDSEELSTEVKVKDFDQFKEQLVVFSGVKRTESRIVIVVLEGREVIVTLDKLQEREIYSVRKKIKPNCIKVYLIKK